MGAIKLTQSCRTKSKLEYYIYGVVAEGGRQAESDQAVRGTVHHQCGGRY